MAIVRWDPFSEMMTMQRDMNRLFASLGMPLYTSRGDGERVAWMPTVDVIRQGDDLVVRAELPGVKPQDVEVTLTDDVLMIKGSRMEAEEHKEGNYIRKESSFGSFERQIMLPQGTEPDQIKASFHDGILEVTVPQGAKEMKPESKRIPVEGASQRGQMAAGQQPGRTQTQPGGWTSGQGDVGPGGQGGT